MSDNNYSTEYGDLHPFYSSRYGNSRVFTAVGNGKKVIVKTLKPECANDKACQDMLRQEFETTAMLENKYIRRAIDFVKIDGLGDCIIFEYIEGKSLAEHVRVGTLSEKQVKSVLMEVCDALHYMQRYGIVHGNLNPENILVTANDTRARLIDIGIPVTKKDADRELLIKEMTFVAPEIIKGEDFDSRADIYSLGKIMEFIGERNISKQFAPVVAHCTQFSKEQRYDSLGDVRTAITKRHVIAKIIIALLAMALIAVFAVVYVPKIKANAEKERAERLSADFSREVDKIQNELPALCEKYKLRSLSESLLPNWSDDSLRLAGSLMQFIVLDDYKDRAMQLLSQQSEGLVNSRKADFDRLLLNEFKTSTDSLAQQMRMSLSDTTCEQLLIEANKWYNLTK